MTKKAEELQRRIKETQDKAEKYARENSIHTHTSEFRGCKKCGSKISSAYIKSNYCPVCKEDLRPATTLETLKKYQEKISQLKKEIKEEEKKLQKKMEKQATIKWLVKIEYNT